MAVRPKTAREQLIEAMLVRYRDCLTSSSTLPTGEHDSRILSFPPEWNQAMKELDRALDLMRSEPVLRWHTVAFYVDVQYRQVPRYRFVQKRNGGRARMPAGFMLEERRHRAAEQGKADEGVTWLASRYGWSRVHLKAIHEAAGLVALAA